MAQTPAILQYLGQALGYMPSSFEDQARAMQINLTVADFLVSRGKEARSTDGSLTQPVPGIHRLQAVPPSMPSKT